MWARSLLLILAPSPASVHAEPYGPFTQFVVGEWADPF